MGIAFVPAPFCQYPIDCYFGPEAVTSRCQDVSIRIPYKWERPKERLVLKSELSTSKQKATKQRVQGSPVTTPCSPLEKWTRRFPGVCDFSTYAWVCPILEDRKGTGTTDFRKVKPPLKRAPPINLSTSRSLTSNSEVVSTKDAEVKEKKWTTV